MSLSTEEKIEAMREAWLSHWNDRFSLAVRSVESPIEALFIACAMAHWGLRLCTEEERSDAVERLSGFGCAPDVGLILVFGRGRGQVAYLATQVPFRVRGHNYRIDAIFVARSIVVAIELDGHDFHDRTKEQARRDKSRDRQLAAAGITTLRFTGSEVFADPHCVMRDVIDVSTTMLMTALKMEVR